jgi:hypothetical protein
MSFPSPAVAGIHTWTAVVGLPGVLAGSAGHLAGGVAVGYGAALALRRRGLSWTWALVADVGLMQVAPRTGAMATPLMVSGLVATILGRRWQRADVRAGGDLAQAAADRFTPWHAARGALRRLWPAGARSVTAQGMLIGRDQRGAAVRIPLGGRRGASHTLVVGATGSGKTVTQTAIAVRAVEHGMGCVFVDPKGDAFLRDHLRAVAARAGRRFVEWGPDGPAVYNPFARGSETEIADRALSGERYTEPHYLRQAQRYLGHEVRVLRSAGIEISLPVLVAHLDPMRLEVVARRIDEDGAQAAFAYLDSLTARQQRDLSGTRDRLAVLSESDAGRWLDPQRGGVAFDLLEAIRERAVVLFSLDADRRPLLATMLGAAVVQDLVGCVAALQAAPTPCLVTIDEFSAVSAEHVSRLFGRARSAGVSLLLGTQEMSDLRVPGHSGLLEQILGNVGAVVAHRQIVPDSADLISRLAGTRGGWSAAVRSDGTATHTRVREYAIHPDQVKAMPRGWAAVLVPGAPVAVRITRILPPPRG